VSDRSEILANITRLKADHRALRVEMTKAYKYSDWKTVRSLADLLIRNVEARAWRKEKLKGLP
jgi:hypothetical protein